MIWPLQTRTSCLIITPVMVLQALTAPASLQFLAFPSWLLAAKPFSLTEMLSLCLNLSDDSGLNSILILLPLTPQQTSFPKQPPRFPTPRPICHIITSPRLIPFTALSCHYLKFPYLLFWVFFPSPSPVTEYIRSHNIRGLLCFI